MHMIDNYKRGMPVPNVLPPHLIPPSFRTIEAPAATASSGYAMVSLIFDF